jgi:peptidoglycan/LPS O-acetylase OafA/YrhL
METRSAAGDTAVGDSGPASQAYRPHLDGLRAVAVYLVLLFHAGVDRFSGGYIGVDVFFVLSGYLVTQLLLRDIVAQGSIRFGRFYSRRFRRLLPAAFVTLLVTAAVYTAIATRLEVADTVGSFKAAFLYSANWYFIHQSRGYFGADISANPVLHFWSLAVEEQFYLLWPLALGGLFLATRRLTPARRMPAIRLVVAGGALASAAWALSLRTSSPDRAYYGTDTRAYELLAGALLALVPVLMVSAARHRRAMRVVTTVSVLALGIIASTYVHFDAIERGIAVTITTCAILVAIEAADGGVVKRLLSSSPIVYLGRISYGTYLWHWIVILVLLRSFHTSSIATVAIAGLVATALASLSFEMLEHPIRVSGLLDRHRVSVIALGLAISLVSALVLIPKVVNPAHASTSGNRATANLGLTPVPKNIDFQEERRMIDFRACVDEPVARCLLVNGNGRKVLLIGDSHAWAMAPLFAELARRANLQLSLTVNAGCPWQRHLYTELKLESCRRWNEDVYRRVIPTLDPDVIIVVNLAFGSPGKYRAYVDSNRNPVGFGPVAAETNASIAALRSSGRSDGRDVVVIEPLPLPLRPNPDFNPLTCLSSAPVVEQCRYEANASPSQLELLYRRIDAQDPKVRSLDLDRNVCPLFPTCDPMIAGVIVKWDKSHITKEFAITLVPVVDTYLKSVGIIPQPVARR